MPRRGFDTLRQHVIHQVQALRVAVGNPVRDFVAVR